MIGVLALQGDFRDHIKILKKLKSPVIEVKTIKDLNQAQALIIPGGESTTLGKLLRRSKLDTEIKLRHQKGMPIWGTCAGAILLAKEIIDHKQLKLSILDISVARNAYGRQIESFEADLKIKGMFRKFRGIFIRAPHITEIRNGVKILSEHNGLPVLVETDKILASTFHPELTEDTRIHKLFLSMII